MRLHVQIPAVRWAVPNALYDKALISTQQRRKALQNDPQASRCKIIVGFETISEHAYAFTAWRKKYNKRCFRTFKYRGCSLHCSHAFKSKRYRKPNDNRYPSLLQLKTNDSSWEWEGMRKTLHIHLFYTCTSWHLLQRTRNASRLLSKWDNVSLREKKKNSFLVSKFR